MVGEAEICLEIAIGGKEAEMAGQARKLAVGIQDFEKLITGGCLYVDKTEYLYRLVHSETPFFLSRPRRFGKSLLLSSMKAYWEGRKDLFQGLAIEKLEEGNEDAWQAWPVFILISIGMIIQESQPWTVFWMISLQDGRRRTAAKREHAHRHCGFRICLKQPVK